jgi:uridine kinase
VLIVDGTFLQSPELIEHWDERIWVNTSFRVARDRGSVRDAQMLGGQRNAERLFDLRYHEACRLYVDAVRPADRATAVFENDDLNQPIVRFCRSIAAPNGMTATPIQRWPRDERSDER